MWYNFLILLGSADTTSIPSNQVVSAGRMEVWFPPENNPTVRIVSLIDEAKKSVWIQAYQLTSQPIADALLAAFKRGVKIVIIADRTQTGGTSCVPLLAKEGVDIWIDHRPPIAHNKVFVIDEQHVVCGSFNYSSNATKNAENCVIFINERGVAALYLNNMKKRLEKSSNFSEYKHRKEKKAKGEKVMVVKAVKEKKPKIVKPKIEKELKEKKPRKNAKSTNLPVILAEKPIRKPRVSKKSSII